MGHVGKTKRQKTKNWARVPICCEAEKLGEM